MSLQELSFEIIRKCPNNCLHCSSMSSRTCTECITRSKFEEVVSAAKKLGLRRLCLSGGEPMLHKDIAAMAGFAADLGVECVIYTSGITLGELGAPQAIDEDVLAALGGKVTALIFNVVSGVEPTYDRIMGTRGCLPYLVESVERARAAGISAEAHFVPMRLNVGDLERTIAFCREIGIGRVSVLRLVVHGRASEHRAALELTQAETEALKARLALIAATDADIRVGVPLTAGGGREECQAATGKLNIRYDGAVFPCEAFKNRPGLPGCKAVPESIYDREFDNIYHFSEYLYRVRNLVGCVSVLKGCEGCAGQQLLYGRDSGGAVEHACQQRLLLDGHAYIG